MVEIGATCCAWLPNELIGYFCPSQVYSELLLMVVLPLALFCGAKVIINNLMRLKQITTIHFSYLRLSYLFLWCVSYHFRLVSGHLHGINFLTSKVCIRTIACSSRVISLVYRKLQNL